MKQPTICNAGSQVKKKKNRHKEERPTERNTEGNSDKAGQAPTLLT